MRFYSFIKCCFLFFKHIIMHLYITSTIVYNRHLEQIEAYFLNVYFTIINE